MTARHTRIALGALALVTIAGLAACQGTPSRPVVVPRPSPGAEPTSTPEVPPLSELSIELEVVADGFKEPLFVTGAGDGSGRLFVVEKGGKIWVVKDGKRLEKPFLDISNKVSTSSEQGLLGLAFSPNFEEDGAFWIDYTRKDGATVVASYLVGTAGVNMDSEYVWLTVPQPYANHNGGMIAFGPDNMLYVALGDGGSGGDPHKNGQNLGVLLGKILRLNVLFDASEVRDTAYGIPADNPFVGRAGARGEIWAYGLRNPWRFSFDSETGDLWIGDVGQSTWEEIDFQPASSGGGENYGWNVFEASHPYPPNSQGPGDTSSYTMPVVEYPRTAGVSVSGGYVYRGGTYPDLVGTYFYGDYGSGRIWGLRPSADGTFENRELTDTDLKISSFGEDDDGELYVVDIDGGGIYRIKGK